MMKETKLLPILVVLLLAASVCPGFASASPVDEEYTMAAERAELIPPQPEGRGLLPIRR